VLIALVLSAQFLLVIDFTHSTTFAWSSISHCQILPATLLASSVLSAILLVVFAILAASSVLSDTFLATSFQALDSLLVSTPHKLPSAVPRAISPGFISKFH
jgi:hypothetical protein